MSRRVCVFTGTRAEYGLLSGLMRQLQVHQDVELQVMAGGTHYSADHGQTHRRILDDGFGIDEALHTLVAGDTSTAVATSLGLTVMAGAHALARLAPDVVVLLGDRYEALGIAQSSLLLGIPVAHLHGGEITLGAIDESIRHAITKLSHIHFAATRPFADRIVQMGEDPRNVHVVGALGVQAVQSLSLLDQGELEADLDLDLNESLVVTFHPVTQDSDTANLKAASALTKALDDFEGMTVVMTRPNADPVGDRLTAHFSKWADAQPDRVRFVPSLGLLRYMSAVAQAQVVVGNSSSGLIEAPALGTPTVNIGTRQDGRPRAESVIDCLPTPDAIGTAITAAINPEFLERSRQTASTSPYEGGETAERITDVLTRMTLDESLLRKVFHDC